jgi:polyferredoxin
VLPAPRASHAKPKSTMGPWRAAALIGIHLLIIAHVVQWLLSGMSDGERNTLSPIEPSEAMFTLDSGMINAGFIMFSVAILSTLIFGRWFCGWACHVVALQDFCGWLMKKMGIHPKPWRSRILLWAPTLLALYMFVWPTFRREVLARLFGEQIEITPGVKRYVLPPEWSAWLGEVRPWPAQGFEPHFIVENFWATFPEWYIAIPFLLICGFACVYFLGSKGFCTYGCPYGGFFTPVDRLAPVRIRVTDACDQCGHCTAVCTSNVRVSEEVRDYGAVVDPGCMKCMDCVSACPTSALYVGIGAPAILTSPRVSPEKMAESHRKRDARYDMTLRHELVLLLVGIVLVGAYRGLYGSVPLLMAVGIAGVVTYMIHVCVKLWRDTHVRGPFWQLKKSGRVTIKGWGFALATLIALLFAAHGLVMDIAERLGTARYTHLMARATVTREAVLSPGYTPAWADRDEALTILATFKPILPVSRGGVNFTRSGRLYARMTWLHTIAGQRDEAIKSLRTLIEISPADRDVILLAQLMSAHGAKDAEFEAEVERILALNPQLEGARRWLAMRYVAVGGRADNAAALYASAEKALPRDVRTLLGAIEFNLAVGRAPEALRVATDAVARLPKSVRLRMDLATAQVASGKFDDAMSSLRIASTLDPDAPEPLNMLADIHESRRELKESSALRDRAAKLRPSVPVPASTNDIAPSATGSGE